MKKEKRVLKIPDIVIVNKIFELRNKKIMLDKDLAELYDVTTGNLNKAVKRNVKRFPDDFMFQLTEAEFKNLIFQFSSARYYEDEVVEFGVITHLDEL